MKKLILLLILPFLLACSSDENAEIQEGEKEAVTAKDLVGSWMSENSDNGITYQLYFNIDMVRCNYVTYKDGNIVKQRNFNYTISGFKMLLKGGETVGASPMNETEIYKINNKLYFNGMSFLYTNK